MDPNEFTSKKRERKDHFVSRKWFRNTKRIVKRYVGILTNSLFFNALQFYSKVCVVPLSM